ncbi:MAG: TonB-dependent receptor [Cyanobacteria bacterium P01_B01_bin.77]
MVNANNKLVQYGPLLGLIGGLVTVAMPVKAAEVSPGSKQVPSLVQATPAQIVEVRLETNAIGDLVVYLDGDGLQAPTTQVSGNILTAELENAALSENFQQANPVDGIVQVQVNNLPNNRVAVVITGIDGPPVASFMTTATGISLEVAAGSIGAGSDLVEEPLRLVVSATRTAEDSQDVPRSVTTITRNDIAQQTQLTSDLGAILGQLVPGLAPTTGTPSEFGQSLRGRNLFVLIDGVPQAVSRNGFRNLRTIDPAAIERIEVLRGPTAIYGDGATGGVVNIITRAPAEEGIEWESRIGLTAAPTNVENSLGGNVLQYVGGRDDNVDFAFTASYRSTGGFFDGDGNRIPTNPNGQGGLSAADTLNVLGKIGIDLDDDQRLQVTLNHFYTEQNTDFTTSLATLGIPGRQRARALEGLSLDTPQRTTNTVFNLDYEHNNVLDGDFTSQFYYRDYNARFFPFDARSFAGIIFQSEVDTEQLGGRLQFDTPLFDQDKFLLTWGADFRREDTSQPLNIFDPAVFETSDGLVFNQIGELVWVPPFQQRTLGLFAQANWDVSDRLKLLGGLRHERVGVDAEDFTTLAGNAIVGGELTYDETLFNIGGVLDITDDVNVFANFAQGFSLADVGLVLRNAPAGFSVETLRPEAQKVDHYEVGIRGEWQSLQAALVGFYNESELGTTFTAPGEIVRAPERVYGVEASVDSQLSDTWFLGGTFTWQEGETDPDLDDDFSPLSGFRIAPIKVTAYVENQTTPSWRNRLQALFSADRDRFDDESVFGQRSVNSYITLDYISSLALGDGTLEIGVQNLLDTDYFPVVSQLQTNELTNAAAQGRFVTIGYTYKW